METIAVQGLTFGYLKASGHRVLREMRTSFDRRDITLITGPSGCGKSTLLYLMAGIYPQSAGFIEAGQVRVEGRDPAVMPPWQRCRLVGMLFQNPDLQFCMDTLENELIFCLENVDAPREEIGPTIDRALAFCEIEHLRRRALSTLSGGEKQRAMLCCLVALRPRWLLLDEPFANLDDATARSLALKIAQLHREQGVGVVAVDHRVHNWVGLAERMCVLAPDGTPAADLPGPGQVPPEQLWQLGVSGPGQHYRTDMPVVAAANDTPVLELFDVAVHYGDRPVLRGVNARLFGGRTYAIVGDSGCGKTTLFAALSGMVRAEGQILLCGQDLQKRRRQLVGRIGFVTQSPQDQFVADTVLGEIEVSLRRQGPPEQAAQRAEEILREIGLYKYRRLSPYMLSQGQQRRLGVAALLAYDCQVLVADEPTYAQDLQNTLAVMEALHRQVRQRGIALLMSTHDRQLAHDYADLLFSLEGGVLREVDRSCL